MRYLRFLLFPFSLLYGGVVVLRNFLFDKGVLKSKKFDFPIISVGNISVGGTGKTPHSEYLIALLQDKFPLAFLSRGYRRKTKGFVLCDGSANAQTIGDEPFQVAQKFPKIRVAVDEKRVHGIEVLRNLLPQPKVVILDDAFQHRYVQAGLSILLTNYNRLWFNDFLLPMGRLREPICGAKRADLVVVTKCPTDLSEVEKGEICKKLKIFDSKSVFFTTYRYAEPRALFAEKSLALNENCSLLLVTGIVSSGGLVAHLQQFTKNISLLNFPDHHFFSPKDIVKILTEFDKNPSENKAIIVTEKDAARFKSIAEKLPEIVKNNLFSVGIEVDFLSRGDQFDQQILTFVSKFYH